MASRAHPLVRRLAAALALSAAPLDAAVGAPLRAQLPAPPPAPAAAALPQSARSARLEIRPRVGDTLRMRLDQEVEMSGTTRVAGVDSTVTVTTRTRVLAHSVVERSDTAGTTVLAVTDSVVVSSSKGNRTLVPEHARAGLQGRRVQLLVAPDGGTRVTSGADDLVTEIHAAFAQMPAMLPRAAVAVGDTWTRKMQLPSAGPKRAPGGWLTATFRLDSLTRQGELAFVSMRGTLARDGTPDHLPPGAGFAMTGVVAGRLVVDRRRGWMTDAHTTLTVRSTVTPPPGREGSPMKVRMTVTQWLRAL